MSVALPRPTPASTKGDWRLVARKELVDLLGRLGRKPLTRTLGVVAVFGLLIPLRFQAAGNLPAFFAAFMAFVPSRLVAIESFAGERERGTLESLLALPLTDRGIAIGKIAAATVYGAARGWLFVAFWLPAAVLLKAVGFLQESGLPSATVIGLTLIGCVAVAAVTALFGVWQSANAPSVRAIQESGGLLRLVLILGIFFVVPWLFGLLSPSGNVPTVRLPGGGSTVSAEAVVDLLLTRPGVVAAVVAGLVLAAIALLILLFFDTLRRSRRERLALVGDGAPQGS